VKFCDYQCCQKISGRSEIKQATESHRKNTEKGISVKFCDYQCRQKVSGRSEIKQATESHRKNTEKGISVKFCDYLWLKQTNEQ